VAEIHLEGIGHRYGDGPPALTDIDLTWEDGGAYALLGPSGCGKTTMLDIISGLVTPTCGRVLVDGVDVTQRSSAERNIAQVFQFPVLYDGMTVEQNLCFPLRNRKVPRDQARRRAGEIAEVLGVTDLLPRRARGLSAEDKQLVSLGRALVRRDVAAILFDEPLTVADPHRKWELRQALKRVHAELSHTLIYVTHDQTEALTFADVVVVMNAGQVVQKGSPDELFERPAHRFVGHFIGSPGMNVLPCSIEHGVVSVAGKPLVALPPEVSNQQGDDDIVGARPEFVECVERGAPGALAAEVIETRDLGAAQLVALRLAEMPLVARVNGAQAPRPGPCGVRFSPGQLHVFRQGRRIDGTLPLAGTTEITP
jgi:glycerol transport system ATP-binding protein